LAKSIVQNPGDVFLHLQRDEYNALMALLSEFDNPDKLLKLCEKEQLEVTPQQCERLAKLWGQIAQGKR
jgi:hypothetical protein